MTPVSDASPLDLEGRRALVTGAGHRVGRAIALSLARAGMQVAVHYSESRAGAEETCQVIRDLGSDAFTIQADLRQRDACRTLIDGVLSRFGGLDLLVPSAASFERVEFSEVDDAAWDRSLELNLASPFAL